MAYLWWNLAEYREVLRHFKFDLFGDFCLLTSDQKSGYYWKHGTHISGHWYRQSRSFRRFSDRAFFDWLRCGLFRGSAICSWGIGRHWAFSRILVELFRWQIASKLNANWAMRCFATKNPGVQHLLFLVNPAIAISWALLLLKLWVMFWILWNENFGLCQCSLIILGEV